MSTVAFHHLPDLASLRSCFSEIARVLQPQGALYLVDFARFKSLKSLIFFAYLNRKGQPPESHACYLDYERSMRAAFLHEEYVQLCDEFLARHAGVYKTTPVAFLSVVSSRPERPLASQTREKIVAQKRSLPRPSQRRLASLVFHFRAGGLPCNALA